MPTIAYPSADLPGPPGVTLEAPDGWELLTAPGVQIAIAEPAGLAGFRANLVVTVQRMRSGYDLAAARVDLDRRTAGLPELEDLGTGEIEVGSRTWLASEYGYTQPGSETVVQACRCAVVDRGVAVDVVEVVGSCGADRAEGAIEAIRAVQDSVRISIP